jgi:hypothetical protein
MKFRVFLLSLILIFLAIPAQDVFADTGPKPTMEFTFKNLSEGEITIISGILYECDQADCSDAAPLEEGGPQRFTCDEFSCRALAYGFAPYHKLEIEFSDEVTRESNIFETAGFDSRYTVTVQPDDLVVEAQLSLGIFSPTTLALIGCICSLMIGVIVIGLIVFVVRRSRSQ